MALRTATWWRVGVAVLRGACHVVDLYVCMNVCFSPQCVHRASARRGTVPTIRTYGGRGHAHSPCCICCFVTIYQWCKLQSASYCRAGRLLVAAPCTALCMHASRARVVTTWQRDHVRRGQVAFQRHQRERKAHDGRLASPPFLRLFLFLQEHVDGA